MKNVLLSLTLLSVSLFAEEAPINDDPRLRFPQAWLDATTVTFHSPGCKLITSSMTRTSRTAAKMQGIPPAPECALTDAEAKKRWPVERAKMKDLRSGGFSESSASLPETPSVKGGSPALKAAAPTGTTSPMPVDRNAVMAAGNFYGAKEKVAEACSRQWGDDAKMVQYCIGKQLSAISQLEKGRPFGADAEKWGAKRLDCASRWPNDYAMRVYCESKD